MLKLPDGVVIQKHILESLQNGEYQDVGCTDSGGWFAKYGSRSENLIAEQVWHLIAKEWVVIKPDSTDILPLVTKLRQRGQLPGAAPDEFIALLRAGHTRARITGPGSDSLLELRRLTTA